MIRIGVTEVFVDDQDRARAFYTEALGLRVKTDVAHGGDACWVTVVSPLDPSGTELLLSPLNDAAVTLEATRRESGSPAISFTTYDCGRAYAALTANGVVFRFEPRRMDHGGIDAVFEDGCGNLCNLHQE